MTLGPLRFTNALAGTVDWLYPGPTIDLQSPASAQAVNGTTYLIYAESLNRSQWEIATGAYDSATGKFPRTTILFNSLGTTAKINFNSAPQVYIYEISASLAGFVSAIAAQSFTTAQKAQAQNNIAVPPTTQSLTSGTAATYTTGIQGGQRASWIEAFWVGGGGGGAGCVNGIGAGVAGTDGTKTTFNGIDAAPGKGGGIETTGNAGQSGAGGAGGTGGTGAATRRMPGQPGQSATNSTLAYCSPATAGGSSVLFGGGGAPVIDAGGVHTVVGNAGAANTGGGGSGALDIRTTNNNIGAAGGAGECAYLLITNPAATYTYTIGSGGAGGVSSTNGGSGGSGFIFVIEHYGS